MWGTNRGVEVKNVGVGVAKHTQGVVKLGVQVSVLVMQRGHICEFQ